MADNGSTDNTAEVAHSLGALVSSEPIRGYGRNCLAGFKMACTLGADIVVFLDGDGSDDPADLPMMLAPLSVMDNVSAGGTVIRSVVPSNTPKKRTSRL